MLSPKRNLQKGERKSKMVKEKACKICKKVYEVEETCPECGSKEFTNSFKGKIIIVNPEKSEIAQKLNMKKKGIFAIKTR